LLRLPQAALFTNGRMELTAQMSNTESSNEWREGLIDAANLAPLPLEVLLERRAVILANRRARKAAKPAYINTDASWRHGVAGLAYDSGALGQRIELVRCEDNHAAEYLALLMAMSDAENALAGPVAFRTDSATVVNLRPGRDGQYAGLHKLIARLLARHPEWTLALVEGYRNRVADSLSRRPFGRRPEATKKHRVKSPKKKGADKGGD
jgi:ribonuclease HI